VERSKLENDEEYEAIHNSPRLVDENLLDQFKAQRIFHKKLAAYKREFLTFVVFLFIVFYVSYSNLSNASYTYGQLFMTTFVQPQSLSEMGLNNVKFHKFQKYLIQNSQIAYFFLHRFKPSTDFGHGQLINWPQVLELTRGTMIINHTV
jgi:hypothetical protein